LLDTSFEQSTGDGAVVDDVDAVDDVGVADDVVAATDVKVADCRFDNVLNHLVYLRLTRN
jgi:hypothetical protein